MTGFIASLVGSNPREGEFLILFFQNYTHLHHIPVTKKDTSKHNKNIKFLKC